MNKLDRFVCEHPWAARMAGLVFVLSVMTCSVLA